MQKITNQNLKYIKKWVELLRSGEFKQAQHIGSITDGKGCLAAILVRAMLLEDGVAKNFTYEVYNLLTPDGNWYNLHCVFESKIVSQFLEFETDKAWSFDKMADYLTNRYL